MSCKYRANSGGQVGRLTDTTGRTKCGLTWVFESSVLLTKVAGASLPSRLCGFDSRHPLSHKSSSEAYRAGQDSRDVPAGGGVAPRDHSAS